MGTLTTTIDGWKDCRGRRVVVGRLKWIDGDRRSIVNRHLLHRGVVDVDEDRRVVVIRRLELRELVVGAERRRGVPFSLRCPSTFRPGAVISSPDSRRIAPSSPGTLVGPPDFEQLVLR